MKAMRLHQFGGPEVLCLETLETPTPKANEVLIRNHAAGVNPIDWKTREGGGARPFLGEPPLILGWECAGVVESVGEQVSLLRPGDRVCGLINFPQAGNCYADRLCAEAEQLAELPTQIPFQRAAGLPIAGLTAWQALFDIADLKPGQRVLIQAAAGGVGHLAVQLAKWKGAYVLGTASANNHEWLKQLGCDEPIDYRQGPVAEQAAGVDVVIDSLGGDAGIRSLDCLKPGGTLVTLPSVTATQVIEAAQTRGLNASGIRVQSNPEQLRQLIDLMVMDQLQLRIDRVFSLQDVGSAHLYSQTGHASGKIILEM